MRRKLLFTIAGGLSVLALVAVFFLWKSPVEEERTPETFEEIIYSNMEKNLPTFDFDNPKVFATVNGVPVYEYLFVLRKELYKAAEEFSRNNPDEPNPLGLENINLSDEQIVLELARNLLFIEYARTKGVVVHDSEIASEFSQINDRRQQSIQEGDPTVIQSEQADNEMFELLGITRDEANWYLLKDNIHFSLCSTKYVRTFPSDGGYSDVGLICDELLSNAEIVYFNAS